MSLRSLVIASSILLVVLLPASAQTWVTAWTTGSEGLSTSEGGVLLTVEETADPSNLWDAKTETFASGGLTSASGSYRSFAQGVNGVTLSFTLESGYVFDKFWLVDTKGDTSDLITTLGTGTWTILESVAGSTGTAFLTNGDTELNHAGALIASAGVGAVNSFELSFDDQLEDSAIGIAYSVVAVPEPSVSAVLGFMALFSLTRRRRC